MAVEVYTFTISVPKGGTALRPQVFNLTMPVRVLNAIEVYVPAGSNGQLYFGLGAVGTITLPTNAGGYILANDEVIHWPLEHQIDSGAWQLFAYNTGSVPHLIHLRFLVTPPGLVIVPSGATIFEQISFTGGGGGGGGGQPPGVGATYSFAIETPLAVLDVAQAGSGTVTLLLDEVGTRPGPYAVTFTGAAAGLTLSSVVGDSPTAITLAASASPTLAPRSYTATVTVSNGGITNTATLTIAVAAGTGGGGAGGGVPPSVSGTPTAVLIGGTLTVAGVGWTPYQPVSVYLGGVSLITIASDANGAFGVTVTLPSILTAGSFSLSATGPVVGVMKTVLGGVITVSSAAPQVSVLDIFGGTYHLPSGGRYQFQIRYRAFNVCTIMHADGTIIGNVTLDSKGIGYFPQSGGITVTPGTLTWYIISRTDIAYPLNATVTVVSP